MNTKKIMLLSLTAVSLMMLPLLAWSPHTDHLAVAQKSSAVSENQPLSDDSDNVSVSFEAPETIYANELTTLKMMVSDSDSEAPLTHVDWAIAVKDPNGNIIYKTTTAHSHVGMMDLNLAFPMAGENTVSLTTSSIGLKMMGMDVPGMARTHTMLSGDPMEGWKQDPDNDFGTRTYEFPVVVLGPKQVKTISGSEKGTSLNVELATNADQVVAGQPVTLVFTVTNAKDGSMITHPDMLLKVRSGSFVTTSSAPSSGMMMPMNGAYHGHTGVMTYTTTFPRAGQYSLNLDLNSLPVSNVIFGNAKARFTLNVAESVDDSLILTESAPGPNTVNIVGIEAPFFTPNNIDVQTGTTLTFVNIDGNMHTVTTIKEGTTEPDGKIDSGIIKAGESFTAKFDKSGTYDYFCAIHPGMKGTVNVS